MRRKLGCACLVLVLATVTPTYAHHYYAAAFDASNPTTLKGVVTKIAWVNPHAQFFIDVKDKAGRVVNWRCETGSPSDLTRRGLRQQDVKAGDAITIDGNPRRTNRTRRHPQDHPGRRPHHSRIADWKPGAEMRIAAAVFLVALCASAAAAQEGTENGATFDAVNARIYYHVIGSGGAVPLVVVNGGPGFDHNYLHISTAWNEIAKNRRVVFYDQRGTGRSPAANGAVIDLSAQVDDLRGAEGEAQGGADRSARPLVGGYLVMVYSARHPERINHLMILDSAAPKWSDTLFLFDNVFPETTEQQRAAQSVDESIRLYFTMLFYSSRNRDAFMARSGEFHYDREINQAMNEDLGRQDRLPTCRSSGFRRSS